MNILNYSSYFFNPISSYVVEILLDYDFFDPKKEKLALHFVYEPNTKNWKHKEYIVPDKIQDIYFKQKEQLFDKLIQQFKPFFELLTKMFDKIHEILSSDALDSLLEVKSSNKVNKAKYSKVEYVINSKDKDENFIIQFCLQGDKSINHINFHYQKTDETIRNDMFLGNRFMTSFSGKDLDSKISSLSNYYHSSLKDLIA